jgi:hypothetical protein
MTKNIHKPNSLAMDELHDSELDHVSGGTSDLIQRVAVVVQIIAHDKDLGCYAASSNAL